MSPIARLSVRRTLEMAAVFMIGDGTLGLLQPARHVGLWRSDMRAVDALVDRFDGRPGVRRGYGLVQIAAGIALASALRRPARAVEAIDGARPSEG
jgi:hypothetical protein